MPDSTNPSSGNYRTLEELGILNINIQDTDIVKYNRIDHIVTVTNGNFTRVDPSEVVSSETFKDFSDRIENIIEQVMGGGDGAIGRDLEFRVVGNELQWRYVGTDKWNIIANSSSWKGDPGDPGLTAYEIAVKEGFVGNEQQWLDSLCGKSAYQLAVLHGFVGTEEQWLESLKGKSLYEIMIEHGFNGSEEDFYEMIKNIPTDVTIRNEKIYLVGLNGQLIGTGIHYPSNDFKEGTGPAYGVFQTVDGKTIYNKNLSIDEYGNITITNLKLDGSISGNAETATRLEHPFVLGLTGEVTGSVEIDGSKDVNVETLLSSSPVYVKDTAPTDSFGREGALWLQLNPKYFE